MAAPHHVEKVFDTIREMTNQKGFALRQEIINATGLKHSLVDESIKDLIEDQGRVIKLRSGVCAAKPMFEEFPSSTTALLDGRLKIENGEQMMTITPLAARDIVKQLAGQVMFHGK